MAYRRRNRLRRRNARPITKRALKRRGRGIKGASVLTYGRPNTNTIGMDAFSARLGVVGRRRNASRLALLMQKRKRTGGSIGGELTFKKKMAGRYRKYTIPKLLKLGFNRVQYRFQGVNRLNANTETAPGSGVFLPPGFFRMKNQNNGTGYEPCPLYVFDLMQMPNNSATSGAVCYRMGYAASTLTGPGVNSAASWTAVNGQNQDGGGALEWFPEDSYAAGVSTINQRFIQTDWFDFRFVLHGCTNQPTYYDIMVVNYSRDHIQPIYGPDSTQTEEIHQYGAYWEGMVKNLLFNPIMPGRKDQFRGMNVLKRFRTVLQPTRTDENDANPNTKVVKFFYKHYKTADYNWGGLVPTGENVVDAANFVRQDPGALRNHPKPRDRLFLIVRASNTTNIAEANETRANTPSFDMVMRKQCYIRTT